MNLYAPEESYILVRELLMKGSIGESAVPVQYF